MVLTSAGYIFIAVELLLTVAEFALPALSINPPYGLILPPPTFDIAVES